MSMSEWTEQEIKIKMKMTEEEIKELGREYVDTCTKRAGFVILTENIKSDFIDLFVAGFMKCLELNEAKLKEKGDRK